MDIVGQEILMVTVRPVIGEKKEGYHFPHSECCKDGCGYVVWYNSWDWEKCTSGTHLCEKCGEINSVEGHTERYEYESTNYEGTHRKIRICDKCDMYSEIERCSTSHLCGKCDNYGYGHGVDETAPIFGSYDSANDSHTYTYKCLNSNCSGNGFVTSKCSYKYTSKNSELCQAYCVVCTGTKLVSHVFVNGKCLNCEYSQNSSGGDTGGDTGDNAGDGSTECTHQYVQKNSKTEHWEECSLCGVEKSESRESHKGASHKNGGKCTVCEYLYDGHAIATDKSKWKKTETEHTPVYYCTNSSCTETEEGEAEAHEGANHENGGTCTVCGYVYDKHEKSTEIKYYDYTREGHKPMYKCTNSSCTETYEGEEEEHYGGSHERDGKCIVCDEIYRIHRKIASCVRL